MQKTAQIVVVVVRDLLRSERFTCHTDLTDALYRRLSELHIPATAQDVHQALALLGDAPFHD